MSSQRIFEGTGEEIAKYAQEHRQERFQLFAVTVTEVPVERGPGSEGWEQMMRVIHSFKGKLRSQPLEATSTEALYD